MEFSLETLTKLINEQLHNRPFVADDDKEYINYLSELVDILDECGDMLDLIESYTITLTMQKHDNNTILIVKMVVDYLNSLESKIDDVMVRIETTNSYKNSINGIFYQCLIDKEALNNIVNKSKELTEILTYSVNNSMSYYTEQITSYCNEMCEYFETIKDIIEDIRDFIESSYFDGNPQSHIQLNEVSIDNINENLSNYGLDYSSYKRIAVHIYEKFSLQLPLAESNILKYNTIQKIYDYLNFYI